MHHMYPITTTTICGTILQNYLMDYFKTVYHSKIIVAHNSEQVHCPSCGHNLRNIGTTLDLLRVRVLAGCPCWHAATGAVAGLRVPTCSGTSSRGEALADLVFALVENCKGPGV
ncbi:hypothetical protein J6590_038890 [Homalodisca vitripennis]|nr:hypothetical protein J6590_038890 [Homalodisca vitripennis]